MGVQFQSEIYEEEKKEPKVSNYYEERELDGKNQSQKHIPDIRLQHYQLSCGENFMSNPVFWQF